MESTAYKVKRSEPLAVSDIQVAFRGDFPSHNAPDNENGFDDDDDDDDDEHYATQIFATITGRETMTGKRVNLGEMNADYLHVQKAVRSPYGLW
jgi:hypothetical protein